MAAPGFVVAAFMAISSWYGGGEPLNKHTATGEVFNPHDHTAASRTLPFGTRLRVTFRGRSTTVRVNDRGPAGWTGRSLDLSQQAASDIGLIEPGAARVKIEVVSLVRSPRFSARVYHHHWHHHGHRRWIRA